MMMNKLKAKKMCVDYLKQHTLEFHECLDTDNGSTGIVVALPHCYDCPDKRLEAELSFYDSCIEARVFYTQNAASWVEESTNKDALYRLMNFINARVWPQSHDGADGTLYSANCLICPRIYVTEDDSYDITATTMIDYNICDMAPLEVMDAVTVSMPQILNELSAPIFLLALGKIDVETAMQLVREKFGME